MLNDRVVSWVAVIISSVAIYFSNSKANVQIQASEKYNRLSVIPKLSSMAVFDSTKEFSGIGLSNKGLGPAFITNIQYSVDGNIINKKPYESMLNTVKELKLDVKNISIFPLKKGQIIKDESTIWLFKSRKNSDLLSKNMFEIYKRANKYLLKSYREFIAKSIERIFHGLPKFCESRVSRQRQPLVLHFAP